MIGAPSQKRKLLVALVQARGLLTTLVDLTKEVDDEGWSDTIQNLSVRTGPLSTFKELLEQIARKLGGVTAPGSNVSSAIKRLKWPFDQNSLKEMIISLEQLKSHFLLAIANDHVRLSMAIQQELREVHQKLTAVLIDRRAIYFLSREQKLIVNSLSLIDLSGELDGEKAMEMRTGVEWFLIHDSFRQWHKASPTPSTLFLRGDWGSGKTTICEVTRFYLKAWHQSDADVCVAHVTFKYPQARQLSVPAVLSNIVQQIVMELPYFMEHLADRRVVGGPLLLDDSIDLIRRARRDLKQFYLILDGLDKCAVEMRRDLIKHLHAIEPPLSILLTTLVTTAKPSDPFNDYARVDIGGAEMPADCFLERIKEMLENDPRIAGYLDHNPENIANAAKLIVKGNNGQYVLLKPPSGCFTSRSLVYMVCSI